MHTTCNQLEVMQVHEGLTNLSHCEAYGHRDTGYKSLIFVTIIFLAIPHNTLADANCLSCHRGIEDIRPADSEMMRKIRQLGKRVGDPSGCVVCHGGTPNATATAQAHRGAPPQLRIGTFVRDPGSLWVAERTCGQCHADHVYNVQRSLMQTMAGKIQAITWAWGALEGRSHKWSTYTLDDPDGRTPRWGTDEYRRYIGPLRRLLPNLFPNLQEQLPKPEIRELINKPRIAVLTVIRQACSSCHLGVRGQKRRGDWRGMGCSACHIPYSTEGYYEGGDPTISKEEPGHLLTHQIQSSRDAPVKLHGQQYTGIPVETCARCHYRGKRIGTSYQGLMESSSALLWTSRGSQQPKLHGRRYILLNDDVHHRVERSESGVRGGMLCQDCHTSIDVHGDGNFFGTTAVQVEIECTDCHGTPDHYPWELPLGYGDEHAGRVGTVPRGVAQSLPKYQHQGKVYAPDDGYLLTARGNPFGNVVRRGDTVIVYSASGRQFSAPLLKRLQLHNQWRSKQAWLAMVGIKRHIERLECYACHSGWAPQIYGNYVKVDYSTGQSHIDWVESGSHHYPDGSTSESERGRTGVRARGTVVENHGYMRWEEPPLGVNAEGRVSIIMPTFQLIGTVIAPDGTPLAVNTIWHGLGGEEGKSVGGQRGLVMSPTNPHTVVRKARSCESCHANNKALGYGIAQGRQASVSGEGYTVDLSDAYGRIIAQRTQPQIPPTPVSALDLSRFIDDEGKPIQTIGTHSEVSRALNNDEQQKVRHIGTCFGCHNVIAQPNVLMKATLYTTKRRTKEPIAEWHTKRVAKLMRWAGCGVTLYIALMIISLLAGIYSLMVLIWYYYRIKRET